MIHVLSFAEIIALFFDLFMLGGVLWVLWFGYEFCVKRSHER